jgi:HNH endonuclease
MSRYISEPIREIVAFRANYCCEYCKIPANESFYNFQIDHIISLKHGGTTTLENLAYSCFPCNNNKGSDIGSVLLPNRQFVRFFNPRTDIWDEHFSMESGVLYSQSLIGEVTIKLLKINDIDRIIERN